MASSAGAKPAKVPSPALCVDLDGTLIRGDVFWESVLALLKSQPLKLLLAPFWLLGGIANLKHQLATRVPLDPARFSYRQEVLELLRHEKEAGRHIALATAADRKLAENVASHLGLFNEVHASDGRHNLKGENKAKFLVEHYARGYEYVGDSKADIAVWRSSQGAYVVGSEARVQQAAEVSTVKASIVETRPTFFISFRTWVSALRGHHWAKNLLLFLPLALSHNLAIRPVLLTFVGFVLYGCCASGLYVLNDLLDLHSDREHPWKKMRPFAAGELSIPSGLAVSLTFLAMSIGTGLALSVQFGAVLVVYAALTMTYSLFLKKVALLDVFVLSSFYSFRIFAGALISGTLLSQWFLAFSLFLFLSLAMAKRYSELLHASDLVKAGNSGRGYHTGDRELLLALGVGSSFSAVVIFSLYAHSPEVGLLYSSPEYLFLLCPIVLYWLSRNWLLAHRGELKEDPVTLAIRDPVSYAVAVASVAVVAASMIHVNW